MIIMPKKLSDLEVQIKSKPIDCLRFGRIDKDSKVAILYKNLKLCTLVIHTLSSPKAKAFGYFSISEKALD
jgi:hypothetical protein